MVGRWAWVDVNNDGLLDLFVVNYLRWDGRKSLTARSMENTNIAILSSTKNLRTSFF